MTPATADISHEAPCELCASCGTPSTCHVKLLSGARKPTCTRCRERVARGLPEGLRLRYAGCRDWYVEEGEKVEEMERRAG